MKLAEKIISKLEFKQKKNNSLISSIEKIKYHDLVSISHIIDNPEFLNQFSHGWNPSHYAVLNSNPEVLFFISNLYQKNSCDLNQLIQRAKNGASLGYNTLDIAISEQKLEHYLILKHFNITEHKSVSFHMQNNSKHWSTEDKKELNLPFEYSLINLFLCNFQYVGLKLLQKNFDYDEKPQIIKEFLENHLFMIKNYFEKPVFNVYSNFFSNLIDLKDNLDINYFDFFAVVLLKDFELKKEKLSYSSINSFDTLYKDDFSQFFQQFSQSQYKDELIHMFLEMNQIIHNTNNKNIKNFFENHQIEKFLLSLKLEEKLSTKNIAGKKVKI